MPSTSRRYALPVPGGQRCGLEALPARGLCQELHDEYLSIMSVYQEATKKADTLEILLVDIASRVLNDKDCVDPDEFKADGIIVAKDTEKLQSAIRGRKKA